MHPGPCSVIYGCCRWNMCNRCPFAIPVPFGEGEGKGERRAGMVVYDAHGGFVSRLPCAHTCASNCQDHDDVCPQFFRLIFQSFYPVQNIKVSAPLVAPSTISSGWKYGGTRRHTIYLPTCHSSLANCRRGSEHGFHFTPRHVASLPSYASQRIKLLFIYPTNSP
jgi:hypothetical protein